MTQPNPSPDAGPEWTGWTPDQWAAHFRGVSAEEEDGVPDEELDALMTTVRQREERAEKAKARKARDAQTRAARKQARAPRFVDALRSQPILAALKPAFWAAGFPTRLDDALSQIGSFLRTGKSDVYDLHRPTTLEVTGETRARPAILGAESIIAAFAKVGIEFVLAPTGGLVARTQGGTLPPEAVPQIAAVAPLVRAHLAGTPLSCAWCGASAVTLLSPDAVPSCGAAPDCADPVSEPAA